MTESAQVAGKAVPPSGEKRMPTGALANPALAQQLLEAFDQLQGVHPGFRPAHAKGLMCSGTFVPSAEAAKLTRAPHANRPSTPVTIRFYLDDHLHTDIIAHSYDGFPVRTGEEFLEFLRGAAAAGAGKPEAIGAFLATHPNAKRFVEAPKPIPTSFAREAFFAGTAFKFTNSSGVSRHGRFRIRPDAGTEYLSDQEAATKSPNFLFDELGPRLVHQPAKLAIFVQM